MPEKEIHRKQIIYPFCIPQPPVACVILNEAGQIVTCGTLKKGFCKETLKLSRRRLPAGTYLVKPITLRTIYKYDIFRRRYMIERQEVPERLLKVKNPLEDTYSLPMKTKVF